MTLETELKEMDIEVRKCSFNASAWQIAHLMEDAEGFKEFARKAGFAVHYDQSDIMMDVATRSKMIGDNPKLAGCFKPVLQDGKQTGRFTLDREIYLTSLGALTFSVLMKGE
ncbi:MAG: hypothetical protein WC350_05475 [Candidatus Micrarchaeia archaeon]|jgi:hypothetical protein